MVPELVSSQGQLFEFGRGLVEDIDNPKAVWDDFAKAYRKTEITKRTDLAMRGIMAVIAEKDRSLAVKLLDSLVNDRELASLVPLMQMVIGLDAEGLERLKKSLDTGLTPVHAYSYLSLGGVSTRAPAKELREFLVKLAKLNGGLAVAVEILHMRIFGDMSDKAPITKEVKAAGRDLLKRISFDAKDDKLDHDLGVIVRQCLVGSEGASVARAMCKRLKASILSYKVYASSFNDMLNALAQVQPLEMLNGLLGGADAAKNARIIETMRIPRTNLLDGISEDILFDWCREKPAERFPVAATVISATEAADEYAEKQFTPLAMRMINEAPDPVKVLEVFARRLYPRTWSGSRASILEQNAAVLNPLLSHHNKVLANFAAQRKEEFCKQVAAERAAELSESRQKDERFE